MPSLSNQSLTKHAFAKINLFLHITGKRDDGYHNLQTVFRLIDLYDALTFCPTNQQIPANFNHNNLPIRLTIQQENHANQTITENLSDNLIAKAGLALLEFAKNQQKLSIAQISQLPIIDIHLTKKLPMGAGLGGGSSNCATTLTTLNEIWQLQLSQTELIQIGASLGADVPIFILGQSAIGEGIGELLTPITLPPQQLLLLMPNSHINTKQLFANCNLQRNCQTLSHAFLRQHTADFCDHLSKDFINVFEPIVSLLSQPVCQALKYLQNLADSSKTTPRMTGSGGCVFLPLPMDLDQQINQQTLANWQKNAPCKSVIVKTL
ncbi:4-diphosphocytidyl-2-C-methyl-D-erythritol kinase [Moraxella macacae 0408225]|uniref:4-diphosphocytidyl-2-C-methyl-D-erythritol kinase n=1 Tax=Moraxella macacae 0408225 TaxID=1230338 RepID=L2F8I4_9GAMM|nr:4-(cytidine 5'-diphospho)-2-C-methyl-D-erythritol kinase [Moraxella macacae]ELA09357.1 4-diphosphocytidyl-2-C-methyl-D-erythritol kinase [Moraxella macacae 0408225]